jgi:AhpD family alkylhydroperoxidase
MNRLNLYESVPDVAKRVFALSQTTVQSAEKAGVDRKLLHLVEIRASQINACAFCLDMHTRDARKQGESQRRIDVLAAWRETELFTEPERAALAMTEDLTRLSETRDISDEIYAQVSKHFDEPQIAALVMAICVINTWNRMNVAARTPLPAEQ